MFEKIPEILKGNKKAAICIITDTKGSTPRKIGSKMIVFEDKTILGTIGGGDIEHYIISKAIEIIKEGKPQLMSHKLQADFKMACGGKVDIYIEPLVSKTKLYIFGAGHVGKILANFAIKTDFDVVVIDERNGIFDNWNKEKYTLINENFKEAFKNLTFDEKSYICAISHTHAYDKQIIAYCGKQKFAYLGMLGSSRKVSKITKEFLENNTLTQQEIEQINMPMGLPMSCETPEEIAVSIIAKLIDVKNNKQ